MPDLEYTNTPGQNLDAGQSSFPKRFLFVTDNSTATRRDAKAHATREYRRQQRWRNRNIRPPRVQVKFTWRTKHSSQTSSPVVGITSQLQVKPSSHDQNGVGKSSPGSPTSRSGRPQPVALHNPEIRLQTVSVSASKAQAAHSLDWDPFPTEHPPGRAAPLPALEEIAPRYNSPSPVDALTKGNSDPFGAASIPVDYRVSELMYWSRTWYARSLWPAEASEHEQSSAIVTWRETMKTVISDEASFQGALALASNYMAHTHRNSSARPVLLRQGLRHRGLGLAIVRRRLLDNITDMGILSAIVDLGGAYFYAGDYPATLLHLEAAKHIVDAAGGIVRVPESLRYFVLIADGITSWLLVRRPLFPVVDWDPGPWHRQSLNSCYPLETATPGQPVSVRHILNFNHHLPNAFLRDVLGDFIELVLVRKLTLTIDDRTHRNKIFQWMHVRRSALKGHLLEHYLDIVEGPQPLDTGSALAAAICLVTWYCHSLIAYRSPTVDVLYPVRLLHHLMEAMILQSERGACLTNLKLRLWLYFVGAMAETRNGQDLAYNKQRCFTIRFLAVAQKLRLTSWPKVRDVLRLFLYDDVLDDELAILTMRSDLNFISSEEPFFQILAAAPD